MPSRVNSFVSYVVGNGHKGDIYALDVAIRVHILEPKERQKTTAGCRSGGRCQRRAVFMQRHLNRFLMSMLSEGIIPSFLLKK